MAWKGVITNVGAALLDQWALGGTLTITSAATGTGTVSDSALIAQTSLVSGKQTASIISSEKLTAGIKLKLQITAPNTSYLLQQYGVWAKLGSGTAVLLALFQNTTGITIPSSTEAPDFVYTLFALIKISNTGELEVTVDTSALVSQSTLDEAIESVTTALTSHTGNTTVHITAAERTAWNNKVDKVSGKGLSTNDYTNAEKTKLAGIEAGAQVNSVTGVKGSTESSYRTGNVSLTAANVGAAAANHNHAAEDITSGTLAPARLPAATPASQGAVKLGAAGGAAAYSHTHAVGDMPELFNTYRYSQAGIASFQGSAGLHVDHCNVEITPIQAGSGDPSPSNIRAISGWTGATVTNAGGKNLLQLSVDSRTVNGVTFEVNQTTGTVTANGTATGTIWFHIGLQFYKFPFDVVLSGCPSGGGSSTYSIQCADIDGVTPRDSGSGVTIRAGGRIESLSIVVRSGYTANNLVFRPMLRPASGTSADFEPFRGNVYDVTFPTEAGTVYGGTLDVVSGTLKVDRYGVDPSNWTEMRRNNGFVAYQNMSVPTIGSGNPISSITTKFEPFSYTSMTETVAQVDPGRNTVYVAVPEGTDPTTVQVVYPLASPVFYQLPQERIEALTGQNNVWADCGDTDVWYGGFLSDLDRGTYVTAGRKHGTVLGAQATAEGIDTTASAYSAHAEGYGTTASSIGAHAEGVRTTASYNYSHSEGYETTASGISSHAEGDSTTASGAYSHAEGANTTASGYYSHAEGYNTTANGSCSHVEGEGTVAAASNQHVFGRFNISNTTDVEIVGWGNGTSDRKNIRTLATNGNMTIAGTLTQASDARLKDVHGEVPDVSAIRAVRFRWNDTNGEHDELDHIGYIAQDVEKVAPFLVGDDSNGFKSLDYIALLCAKVEMLERRVAELTAAQDKQ